MRFGIEGKQFMELTVVHCLQLAYNIQPDLGEFILEKVQKEG